MSTRAADVIERVTYNTFFGLGLWDTASNSLQSDGLGVRVFAYAGDKPVAPVMATANSAGIFVINTLPGLRRYELPEDDRDFWREPPVPFPSLPFLVEVQDTYGRYTPFVLRMNLPSTRRGPVTPPCIDALLPPTSPPATNIQYVPLFNTPARAVPPGMAAIRATVRFTGSLEPAAHALLEVFHAGRLVARGIADERGEVSALMAYPEPAAPPPSSPPAGSPPGSATTALPLSQQEWPLELRVRYTSGLHDYRSDERAASIYDLCDLIAQADRTVTTSPPTTPNAVSLRYGGELVIGADTGASAELFISPA